MRNVNKVPGNQREFKQWGDIIRESPGVYLGDLGWHVFRDSDLPIEVAIEIWFI